LRKALERYDLIVVRAACGKPDKSTAAFPTLVTTDRRYMGYANDSLGLD
jgi:hypothetical protein